MPSRSSSSVAFMLRALAYRNYRLFFGGQVVSLVGSWITTTATRVMSFYMMAFLGTAPFGSLIAGWLSSRIGAGQTLLVGGACCVAGAAWFATNPNVQPPTSNFQLPRRTTDDQRRTNNDSRSRS